jgi:hypothetical protein
MQESVIVCYVLNNRLKKLLQQWAEKDDRSASAELRQILEREAVRREQLSATEQKPTFQLSR